ncbi:MAG: AAA family ATPase [Terracidiphilus sp.]
MRRRSRRGPNTSESTGKIGQEIPANQPRPLMPSYLDEQDPQEQAHEGRAREGQAQETRTGIAREPQTHGNEAPGREDRAHEGRVHAARTHDAKPVRQQASRRDWSEPKNAGRLEMETQPESPGVAPPEAQPGQQQAPKGYVVLAIGMPGSGKTTWFRRRGVMPLSSDMLRGILFDDVEEQRFQGLVFSTLRSLLRARLIAKMPWNYVDATNLSTHERRQWIKMAKSFGYEAQAVFFDVPLEVCLERNRSRDRMVSEDVMRKMAEKLKPPVFEEGFEKITVVRVKSANG